MLLLRYKDHPEKTFHAWRFNTHALSEVLTGNDSAYISELDVCIKEEWKDLGSAFRDKDVIPDNYNQFFVEPPTDEDRERGYLL